MRKTMEGDLNGAELKIAIAQSRFNSLITDRLLDGAIDCLIRHGVKEDAMTVVKAPGAFELPLLALRLARSRKYDAIITLGAVVRGATPHFDYVAAEAAKGIAAAQMSAETPIVFGVLTTDSIEQALERAGAKSTNKGFEAALTAIEMANLIRALDRKK